MSRYFHTTLGMLAALSSLPALAQVNCAPNAPGVDPVPVQVANAAIANSRINPLINQRHIFCGEINAGGNAVGFHSRPGSHNPNMGPGVVVQQAADIAGGLAYIVPPGLNHPGPYRYKADVRVWNPAALPNPAWVVKGTPSTFYPDSCTQPEVIASVRYAYMHPYVAVGGGNAFSGPSAPVVGAANYCVGEAGTPFTIRGYLNQDLATGNWVVNTAFPIANF